MNEATSNKFSEDFFPEDGLISPSNGTAADSSTKADRAAQKRAAFLGRKNSTNKKAETAPETEKSAVQAVIDSAPDALRAQRYTELPYNALTRKTLILSEDADSTFLVPQIPSSGYFEKDPPPLPPHTHDCSR
jgi:hypothetical protein